MGEMDAMKDKAQGKFREVKGAATGNTGEELKGKAQGMKGDLQHGMEKARREARSRTGTTRTTTIRTTTTRRTP